MVMSRLRVIVGDCGPATKAVVLLDEDELHPDAGTVYPVLYVSDIGDMMIYRNMSWIDKNKTLDEFDYEGDTDFDSLRLLLRERTKMQTDTTPLGLYVKRNEEIFKMEDWDHVDNFYQESERSPVVVDSFVIGYSDYSLEMSYNGDTLLLLSGDDDEPESPAEALAIMAEEGDLYIEFLRAIPVNIMIESTSACIDIYVGDLREQLLKDIISERSEKCITLHRDDYDYEREWSEKCSVLGVPSYASSVDIYFTKVTTDVD